MQKTHYKCVIFDLDGTLLDTISDIKNAINIALNENGFKANYTINDVKNMLGHGAKYLWDVATKPFNINKEQYDKSFADYMVHYGLEQGKTTKPFKGEVEMIDTLIDNGIICLIYSNKPHHLALKIVELTYGNNRFKEVIGKREGYEPKPSPVGIFEMLDKYGLRKEEVLYVGDSYPDVLTANKAGIDVGIFTFGYGKYNEDWLKDANYIFASPNDLLSLLINK